MKKVLHHIIVSSFTLSVCMTTLLTSCQEDYTGKYKMTNGIPVITSIRYQNSNLAGQQLDGAYMGDPILVIGENLTSIQEIWFNNVKAVLNISLITKNAIFVNVPKELPSVRTNKIYFVTGAKDTVKYHFEVKIPAPSIDRIKCEFVPQGANVVLYGDYFLALEPNLIHVYIGDYKIPASDIVSYEKNTLVFKAPHTEVSGPIEVTTLYGKSGRTKEIFRDYRGMITTFDDDYPMVSGWGRPDPNTFCNDPKYAIMGKYWRLAGEITEANSGPWGQLDALTFHYWGEDNGKPTGNLFLSDPKTSTLKFEVNVVQEWSALGLIFFFHAQGTHNGPMWDNGYPVGIWMPWHTKTGIIPFKTDGWVTVSIPLAQFNKDNQGGTSMLSQPFPPAFGALTIVLFRGGVQGRACYPEILIDNIRVVP